MLPNKVPSKCSGLNKQHFIISHEFCGSEIQVGIGQAILLCVESTGVTWWYSVGGWADLEGPQWLHSYVWHFGKDSWKSRLRRDRLTKRLHGYQRMLRLLTWQLVSPMVSLSRESGESYMAIYDLLSEGYAESLLPYTIGQNSHRPAQIQGEGTDSPLLNERNSKNLGPIFKLPP